MVEKVPGESSDHPHHQSLFFTYDEVNGTNFWNPERTGRRIQQRDVRVDGATLVARLDWKDKDGKVVLDETKRVTFGGDADAFWLDHQSTLLAPNVAVSMGDTKEGAFGLRLNDTLKELGGSGRYINAEGLETAANVWGKTSPWVAIRGAVKDACRQQGRDGRDLRAPVRPQSSALLARTRLRPLRGEPVRAQRLRPVSARAHHASRRRREPERPVPRDGLLGQESTRAGSIGTFSSTRASDKRQL